VKPRPGKKYVLLEEAAVQSARYRWKSPRDAVAWIRLRWFVGNRWCVMVNGDGVAEVAADDVEEEF